MPTVVADATLPAKLAALTEPADVVDEAGRKLGRYIPESAAPEPLIPWEPDLTREDIDRRMQEPGRSWAEIKQRLEKMRPSQ